MKQQIYSFYDDGVAAYTTPFFMHNDGMAIRAFQDMVNDEKKENNISKHPDQFTLFRIGEMDDQNGLITTYEPAKNLGNGVTYKQATQQTLESNQIYRLLEKVWNKINEEGKNK